MIEREFIASIEELTNVSAFIEEQLDLMGCPMKASMQIQVAVEELFVNIAHYAYKEEQGKMTLSIDKKNNSIILTFKDNGIKFDPLAQKDPDIEICAQDRKIGGLGIFMVKKTMDKLEYNYVDNQNILTVVKNI